MIRIAIAATVLAAAPLAALAATDQELKQQIVGGWGQDADCADGSLTFNDDGTFALAQPGRNETGTWDIAGGTLTGSTSDGSSRPDAAVTIAGDTLALGTGDEAETLIRCSSQQ
jgi:hypothetical protein